MEIKVYVATQKKIKPNLDKCYEPVYVGAALKDNADNMEFFGYQRDDEGRNISEKNRSFCELTALYWMWKNSTSEVIGLAHYRRFLSKTGKLRDTESILKENDIEEALQGCDILLPKKECLLGEVRRHYGFLQHIEDYDKLRDVIEEMYPEYVDDFDRISSQDELYICNMFIGKKAVMDNYCKWLFDVLFKLEKRVDISGYSVSDKRIFGYLSERLLNVWVLHNDIKIKEFYLLNTEETLMDRMKKYFHLFNYKVLKIDVLKYAHERTLKRERKK
ncbi:protein of unknown function [Oribacterium sp. KHPX15]|uniref:DUF4422 domain-containing protein n=1 Tax=Oribacterium sp. KHPX15 TaxID=1855342 RepID=UPI00089D975B|nr:DUF4422 domain-containing protein [Oribacterium sp. KHPX15]SEA56863.1 protein of unknown function [Oribacterium sp. KHPX15]